MSQAGKKSKGVRFTRAGHPAVKTSGRVRAPREFYSPQVYAITGAGDCMAPFVCDGDTVICDPTRQPKAMDLAVIYFKDQRVAWLKRLRHVFSLSGKEALSPLNTRLVCESDDPDRMYYIPREKIARVHVVTYNVTQKKSLVDLPYEREWIKVPVIGEVHGEDDIRAGVASSRPAAARRTFPMQRAPS